MGHATYSTTSRMASATASGFYTKSAREIFTQSAERKAHTDMTSKGVALRESCDSEAHPNTVPVQLYLDVTGSMGHIPHDMIKDGLPTLVGTLIQNGVPDVALMFGAIGDHECDGDPLQVGQFESGDQELDMWLTRTYLEGGGGGNAGESYLLAWYFAANHVRTDAWDKRGQKGFVFTVGDEPTLEAVPVTALKEVMGDSAKGQSTITADEALAAAQEKNHVFHIFLEHGGRKCDDAWRQRLGDHLIVISDYRDVPKVISETILKYSSNLVSETTSTTQSEKVETPSTDVEQML